jgi:hypothetical protein
VLHRMLITLDAVGDWSRARTTLAEATVLRGRLSAKARVRARQFTLSRQSAQLHALYSTITTPATTT